MSDAPLPQTQPVRRAVTLPTRLMPRKQRSSDSLNNSEDNLFYHPSAKIVHFAPRALAPIPSSTAPSDFDYPVDTIETLPWRSPTERTVAFAPLRLENVHGLTVFLKCGNVVHAILKNSQCWCVDGETTFVLRIRPLTYYRIELSSGTDEDKTYAVELKCVLPKVLRYEITPCPFKRGFTVEIPEEAMAPRRKRAWRPKVRIESAPVGSVSSKESSPVRKDDASDVSSVVSSVGEDTDATDDSCYVPKANSTVLETIPDAQEPSSPIFIPRSLDIPKRSVTETQQSFQNLLARFETNPEPQVDPELSFSSSVESFHSMEPPSSPPPPSSSHSNSTCPTSIGGAELDESPFCNTKKQPETSTNQDPTPFDGERPFELTRDIISPAPKSSLRALVEEEHQRSVSTESSNERPSALSRTDTSLSDMSIEFRRRAKASRERDVSPMPPVSTLSIANPPEKQDAASIIKHTCTIVLVPPVQLLLVLIHIAARIVIGPALNTALGDLNKRIEYQVTNPQDAVDDFDLPLAPPPEFSRRVSESRETRKPDPFDLD
ncbi:hypothetical protein ASPWEDRAFT_52235 [Aspergillus wentii DTO 134E9]|uniref:Inheritance of peroxisomes protein 1 n=1 Tax=Aspergillus wentii DTO 134E9 TaxID=1073089 RepID=A0A1L9RFZ6_ASPWE|nr:uncharacterized protein ASPWEDRAFT_52235 [Aspergillus wentii DTO 134E9]KAI9925606.1 hypothetical protein MW887_005988 [Aspergillus wentii]OJJ33845.1 hypothetical protein ASPWEDRAFT_52235 [Aspergillus wentii DTO 134E9]